MSSGSGEVLPSPTLHWLANHPISCTNLNDLVFIPFFQERIAAESHKRRLTLPPGPQAFGLANPWIEALFVVVYELQIHVKAISSLNCSTRWSIELFFIHKSKPSVVDSIFLSHCNQGILRQANFLLRSWHCIFPTSIELMAPRNDGLLQRQRNRSKLFPHREALTLFFSYKNVVYKNVKLYFWDILRIFLEHAQLQILNFFKRNTKIAEQFLKMLRIFYKTNLFRLFFKWHKKVIFNMKYNFYTRNTFQSTFSCQ